MGRRQWTCRLALLAAGAAAGCSAAPTAPSSATPAPAVTVKGCTAGAPQSMTSFTADPPTIANGDSFTLSWTAPCGFVSLAQVGQGPFITLQPASGGYQLQPGMAGYPTGLGHTVYEATNGDTALHLDTTVTVYPCCPGHSCNDGDACTYNDTCQSDGSTCRGTAYSCCPGRARSTGNKCVTGEVCQADGSTCGGGMAVNCDDKESCTTDSCNPSSGCQHSNLPDYSSCPNTSGTCYNGKCGPPL